MSFLWDGRSQRYKDKKTGRFVKNSTVLSLIETNIKLKQNSVQTKFSQLLQGTVDPITYQVDTLNAIKYVHTQQYLLGAGGFNNTHSEDYLTIARELKNLHYPAFREFLQQLKDHQLTEAQARQRLQSFILSSKTSYFLGLKSAAKKRGLLYAKRFLSPAEHCQDCINYAGFGFVLIEQLILPGQKCACRYNCKCFVRFYAEPHEK